MAEFKKGHKIDDEVQLKLDLWNVKQVNEQRSKLTIFTFFTILAVSVTLFFTIFKILPSPIQTVNSIDSFVKDYSQLQKDNQALMGRVAELEKSIGKESTNADTNQLNGRVSALETQSQAIADSILETPDKAITTRLLRDQQSALQEDIKATQIAIAATNSRLDTILFVPIIGAIIAAVGALIVNLLQRYKTKLRQVADATEKEGK